jgi:hypothetical protein
MSAPLTCRLSGKFQTFQLMKQRLLHFFLKIRWKFLATRRQVERINRHLSFGIDQGDFNVALLLR